VAIRVITTSSRQAMDRQLDESVPLEDGEQVIVRGPIRLHRPYEANLLTTLMTVFETSAPGALRLTDRRLVLLRGRATKANLVYEIPRSEIRGVAPAGGGYLRLLCEADELPPEMRGIKAGLSAAGYGIAGGLAGAGAAGAAIGVAGATAAQAAKGGGLAAILLRELGAPAA
jgi:hypothetical protein